MARSLSEGNWYRPREIARLEALVQRHEQGVARWQSARRSLLRLAGGLAAVVALLILTGAGGTMLGNLLIVPGVLGIVSLLPVVLTLVPQAEQWHQERADRARREAQQLQEEHHALLASMDRTVPPRWNAPDL